MKKIIPIFFIIIILGFAAFFYFKQDDTDNGKVDSKENLKTEENSSLRDDYKQSVKGIFNEYVSNMGDLEKIRTQKNKLLELKVPLELKALHLDLVLMMTKTESYIQSGEEIDESASEKTIKEIREKHPWIK